MSFGISGDWTFEKHWRNRNPSATIETYDGSISGLQFAVTSILSLLRPHKPKLVLRNWLTAIDYWTFLKSQTEFKRVFIGIKREKNWVDYDTLICRSACKPPFFLKIDIEGHEYEILEEIIKHRPLLSGLAIEFHQPLKNMKTIEVFVSQLGHQICNVHPNNCVSKTDLTMEPSIEMTFSIYQGLNQDPKIPNDLEEDNDKCCEPLRIRFRNPVVVNKNQTPF